SSSSLPSALSQSQSASASSPHPSNLSSSRGPSPPSILQSHNSRSSNSYHRYQSYVRMLDLTHLTEHDRNSSTLSTHLLRLLPIIHDENFTSLNLSFVKGITNTYLTKLLSPFLSHIKTLNLAGGSRSDSCISSVIPNCLSVQHLSLAWNTGISDSSIE